MSEIDRAKKALLAAHNAGDTAAAQKIARHIKSLQAPQENVIFRDEIGGRVIEEAGKRQYVSPGYSTSDPAKIKELMGGAKPVDIVQKSRDEQVLAERPIASRGAAFVRGVPFVGSYLDEAAGAALGPQAGRGIREAQGAMQRQRPGQNIAAGLAGSVAGSVPMVAAAAPAVASRAAGTLGQRVLQGGLLGMGAGAVEGGVYGAGEGQGKERWGNAMQGAGIGLGAGGVLGTAAPLVGQAVQSLVKRFSGGGTKEIAKNLGVSKPAAQVVRSALEAADPADVVNSVRRAGPDAMLADAGQPAVELLDGVMNSGGGAAHAARRAIEARAGRASSAMKGALDTTLGAPRGLREVTETIRGASSGPRKAAYDLAYSKQINHADKSVTDLLRRVPESAISTANKILRVEGHESKQILARVADNGAVTYEVLPDVQQIDYIRRALGDVASKADGQGVMGGTTNEGRVYRALSNQIRDAVSKSVPEYRDALRVAGDAIGEKNAADFGYDLLKKGMKRDEAFGTLADMTARERAVAKQGMRSYLDDIMADVTAVVSDPNVDAREAIKLVKDVSSRSNREKIAALLGGKESAKMLGALNKEAASLEIRAGLAKNSATAVRQAVQQQIKDLTAPGPLETLSGGEPISAGRELVKSMLGNPRAAQASRESALQREIAKVLTERRGADAVEAVRSAYRSIYQGNISDDRARQIAAQIGLGGFLAGNRQGSQYLGQR